MKSFKWIMLYLFLFSFITFPKIRYAQSLRELSDSAGLLIGTYDSGLDLDDRMFPIWLGPSEYAATLSREFNTIVVNVNIASIQPEKGIFDFEYQDSVVAFAEAHNMKIIGQHLLWGVGIPDTFWFNDSNKLSDDSVSIVLKTHIDSVVKRYSGRIGAYSSVNEELLFGTTQWTDSRYRDCIGDNFIDSIFIWAKKADSTVTLYYNETDAEAMGADLIGQRSDSVFSMVSRLVQKGVPIDGVGLQMHTSLGNDPFPGQRNLIGLQNNIMRYASLGLDVFITEMDVTISSGTGTLNEKLAEQGHNYGDILRVCLENDNCKMFNVWGFADQYSWVFQFPDIPAYPEESPLLFDTLFVKKPAYDSLWSILNDAVTSIEENPAEIFPSKFILYQNYPNPFNPETTIEFSIPKTTNVQIFVYDALGSLVEKLINEVVSPGHYKVKFSGSLLSSGVYFFHLKTNEYSDTKKLVLIK